MNPDRAPSPASTVANNSELEAGDRIATHPAPSSPARADPRTSLTHVLDNDNDNDNDSSNPNPNPISSISTETPPVFQPAHDASLIGAEADEVRTPGPSTAAAAAHPKPAASTSRKRKDPFTGNITNPNYVGNKIKHLKKDDGEPLWRKDIQYDFLKAVFDNNLRVFTNSYDPSLPKQNFAELYIDTMARSSKTSKILRDKLLTEHEPAKNMAMVCLLVNLGRMNTTLNCKSKPPECGLH